MLIERDQAGLYVRARMTEAGHTPNSFAEMFGCSKQFVSEVLLGKKPPSGEMLAALGLRKLYATEDVQPPLPRGPKFAELEAARKFLQG